jgi:hypothetical protein
MPIKPQTLAAVTFLAVTAGAAYVVTTREDPKKAPAAAPGAAVPVLTADAIASLTLTDPKTQTTVALARKDGAWRLLQPIADAADSAAVNRVVDGLVKARFASRPAATGRTAWDKLKVGVEDIVTVDVGHGDQHLVLHIGPTGYARVGDSEAVYQVHGLSRGQLAREPRLWRDRTITSFDAKTVDTVTLAVADGQTVTARRTPPPPAAEGEPAGQETWALVAGAELVGLLDEAVPRRIVQRMSALQADDFADGVDRAASGLDAPRMTFTVAQSDGTKHLLLIGTAQDDATYVGRPDGDHVWTLKTATLDYFAHAPLQWRDKTVAKVAPEAVKKIELRFEGKDLVVERDAGGAWVARRPAGLAIDSGLVDELARTVQNLRGVEIAHGVDRKTTGLGAPTSHATFTVADGKPIVLTLGQKVDNNWYLAASTRAEILLVADYQGRHLRSGPDHFTAKAAALPPAP